MHQNVTLGGLKGHELLQLLGRSRQAVLGLLEAAFRGFKLGQETLLLALVVLVADEAVSFSQEPEALLVNLRLQLGPWQVLNRTQHLRPEAEAK